jgi:hypothetical protein
MSIWKWRKSENFTYFFSLKAAWCGQCPLARAYLQLKVLSLEFSLGIGQVFKFGCPLSF